MHNLAFRAKGQKWVTVYGQLRPPSCCGGAGWVSDEFVSAGVMGGGVSVIAPPEPRWEPVVGSSGGHEE